jgi:hypothetical protein
VADNFGRGDIDEKRDRELIASLRENGWPKGLEAIHDERGVSLAGGRREAVAKMLGIEPVIRSGSSNSATVRTPMPSGQR